MDIWEVKCESCGSKFQVQAKEESEAIRLATAQHDKDQEERSMHGCDYGPFMNIAFNLTNPSHPGAPKEW
jgi:hypothetical protein